MERKEGPSERGLKASEASELEAHDAPDVLRPQVQGRPLLGQLLRVVVVDARDASLGVAQHAANDVVGNAKIAKTCGHCPADVAQLPFLKANEALPQRPLPPVPTHEATRATWEDEPSIDGVIPLAGHRLGREKGDGIRAEWDNALFLTLGSASADAKKRPLRVLEVDFGPRQRSQLLSAAAGQDQQPHEALIVFHPADPVPDRGQLVGRRTRSLAREPARDFIPLHGLCSIKPRSRHQEK